MNTLKIKLALLAIYFPLLLLGQNKNVTISGTVKDSQNHAIPFAEVQVKGTKLRSRSDEEGKYTLRNVPVEAKSLLVTLQGYHSAERRISLNEEGLNQFDFTLEENQQNLNEVIVSASRRPESLAQTPSSVTVIGAKELETQSVISPNIANILSYSVPGLGTSTNQTGNSGQTLRGRTVLVLIDGIPQSTPLRAGGRDIRSIDPSVIERVEVIKGATAIYGNGAEGGLINYITKRAPAGKNFGGLTQAGITGNTKGDSTLGYRFSQQFYGKVQKFDYVVSGMFEKTGVYRDADGLVISPEYGLGETKAYNGYAKIGYTINEKQRLQVMYNYFSSRQDSRYITKPGVYGVSPSTGVRGDRPGVDEGTRYNHNANLQYTNQQIFGNTDLTANLYLQDFYTIYSNSLSFYEGGQSAITSTKKGARVNLNTPFSILDQVPMQVNYGLDLMNDQTAQSLVDGRAWVPKMDMLNFAPYLQATATVLDYLTLKGGLRTENINIDVADFNTLADGPNGEGSIAVKGGTLNYNALVFNAGARYSRYKLFNPFISYAQSFSIFELGRVLRAAESNTLSQLQTKAIIVNNYEAGFSSSIGNLNIIAAYYISTSKLGANLQEVNGKYVSQRLPELVHGYEIQLDYLITKGLSVGGNYAKVEGKGDIDDNGSFDGPTDIYLNTNRISPPKATAYIKFNALKDLSVDLNWLYVGNRDRFQPNPTTNTYKLGEAPVKEFDLFNLAAVYQVTPSLRANLGVENLFNQVYYPSISQFYGNNVNYTRGNGRRFNFSLGYSF